MGGNDADQKNEIKREGHMHWRYGLIVMVCLMLPSWASAEFYRYTDKNGVIRFTDSFVDVPVDQRPKVERFAEPDDRLTPAQRAERDRLIKERAGKTTEQVKTEQQFKQADTLNLKKAELDRKTAALLKEQRAVEKEKETVSMSDYAQAKAYRAKVIEFNQRLAEHRKKLADFNAQADVFNKAAAR